MYVLRSARVKCSDMLPSGHRVRHGCDPFGAVPANRWEKGVLFTRTASRAEDVVLTNRATVDQRNPSRRSELGRAVTAAGRRRGCRLKNLTCRRGSRSNNMTCRRGCRLNMNNLTCRRGRRLNNLTCLGSQPGSRPKSLSGGLVFNKGSTTDGAPSSL